MNGDGTASSRTPSTIATTMDFLPSVPLLKPVTSVPFKSCSKAFGDCVVEDPMIRFWFNDIGFTRSIPATEISKGVFWLIATEVAALSTITLSAGEASGASNFTGA